MSETAMLARVPWHWEWVPTADQPADRVAWTAYTVDLFREWTGESLSALRAASPAETGAEFPLTAEQVGQAVAGWLIERADVLPRWARLAWGAAFVDGELRWAPVPVVVEFHRPEADDPEYLMAAIGAGGLPGDVREPTIDYVTTSAGDGVRVIALSGGEEGPVYGRVGAALRLDVPPAGGTAGVSVDVLLSARVSDLGLIAAIGHGVEQLMDLIAEQSGTPGRMRFVPPDTEEKA